MNTQFNEEYYVNLIILNAKRNALSNDGFFNILDYMDLYISCIKDLKSKGIFVTSTDFFKILYYPDLLVLPTLIGMNKEKIEKNSSLTDYTNYLKSEENNYIDIIKNESKNQDINNIIKMIRNSFEHSEYEFSPQDFSLYVYNTGKSGNKYFEAKLDYRKFRMFIDKFYSNNLHSGISDHYVLVVGNSDEVSEKSIFTFNRLVNYISKKIIIKTDVNFASSHEKINYSGNDNFMRDEFYSSFEHAKGKRYNLDAYKEYILEKFGNNFNVETIGISNIDSVNLAKYIIQQNPGFYLMNSNKKAIIVNRAITSFLDLETSFSQDNKVMSLLDIIIRKYILDSSKDKELRESIKEFNQMRYQSGTLNYNYENSLGILYGYNLVGLIEDVGAENFENLKIDNFKVVSSNPAIEERLMYLKVKLEKKGIFLSEEKLYQTFMLVRVRDSFAHGNIKLGLRQEDNDIVKSILILKDDFDNSETTLEICVDDFIEFCNDENLQLKLNKTDEIFKKV